jgi:hypothetical protein
MGGAASAERGLASTITAMVPETGTLVVVARTWGRGVAILLDRSRPMRGEKC